MKTPASALLAALCLSLGLAACSHYALVRPGETLNVMEVYKVTPSSPWNGLSKSTSVALTRHGNGLDELIFFEPVPSGETPFTKAKGTALPLFRKGMTSLELKEVIESGLALSGFHDIQTLAASAQKMDKANASRLEMSMASEKGPRFHGQVLFAEYNEKLYLIVFIAEATTYYPMVWPEAEAMLASMQIL